MRLAFEQSLAAACKTKYFTECKFAMSKKGPMPASPDVGPVEGLRARKRRETFDRITQAAQDLFLEHGYDATTVDDIAAAAGVSKRTFFDYFASKEDVVDAWQDGFGDALTAAIAARPAREPLAVVIEEAMTSAITASASPRSYALDDLVLATPALRAREQLKYGKLEARVADALMARQRRHADPVRARLLAMIAIGGLRIGAEAYRTQQRSGSIEAYTRKLFRMVRDELRAE